MVRKVLPALLLLFVASCSSFGANTASGHSPMPSESGVKLPPIAFEQFTLPNGMQVVLHVDRRLPLVNVNLWFHVGTKNDEPGHYGFAHLFEHLMFQGSKNAPHNYNNYINEAGGNEWAGSGTGRTTWDYTQYSSTVPSGSLEYLLWLDADRVATLPEVLSQERLDNQRSVVKNERSEWENIPYTFFFRTVVDKLLPESMFPAGYPYAHTRYGSDRDLDSATVESMSAFFRTYYAPNNASLVIAGDFDSAQARQWVEKYFGPISRGPSVTRPVRWIPRLEARKSVEIQDRIPVPRFCFVWNSPAYFDRGDAELELAASVLGEASSRLHRLLITEGHMASEVSAGQFSAEDSGLFYIWVTASKGASLTKIERTVSQEIRRLAQAGPSNAELQKAKQKREYDFVNQIETIGGWNGRADRLNLYSTLLGSPDKFGDDYDRYRTATQENVRSAIASWLNTQNFLALKFMPESVAASRPVGEVNRAQVPPIRDDHRFQPPPVASRQLANGLQLMVVERPELPKVSVKLVMRAGSDHDASGKAGLADFTVEAVRKGTNTRSAAQVEGEFADLAAVVSGTVDRDYAALDLDVLKHNLNPSFALLSDLVKHPSFSNADLEAIRRDRLERVKRNEADPNDLAWRIGFMLQFGKDHPYGHPVLGMSKTVEQLTRNDVIRFHRDYWEPGNAVLICVGDITVAEAVSLAERYLGDWTGGKRETITIPAPHPAVGSIFVVDRPGATQTQATLLLPASSLQSADFYPLQLANAVWGGGSTGRLNTNLRQTKGYSYGFYSFLIPFRSDGAWIAQGSVQADKARESLVELAKELKALNGDRPVSDKELSGVRTNLVRAQAQQFQSAHKLADRLGWLWAIGRDVSEMKLEPESLNAATLESVNRAAAKYANASNARLLLVGDAARIRAYVENLNLGELVELDAEGEPVKK